MDRSRLSARYSKAGSRALEVARNAKARSMSRSRSLNSGQSRFSAPGAGDIEMGLPRHQPQAYRRPQKKCCSCCFVVLIILAIVLVTLIVLGLIYKDEIMDWIDGDEDASTEGSDKTKKRDAKVKKGEEGGEEDEAEKLSCLPDLFSYFEDWTWTDVALYGTPAAGAYTAFAYYTHTLLGLPNPINGWGVPCYCMIPLFSLPFIYCIQYTATYYATDSRSKKRSFNALKEGETTLNAKKRSIRKLRYEKDWTKYGMCRACRYVRPHIKLRKACRKEILDDRIKVWSKRQKLYPDTTIGMKGYCPLCCLDITRSSWSNSRSDREYNLGQVCMGTPASRTEFQLEKSRNPVLQQLMAEWWREDARG